MRINVEIKVFHIFRTSNLVHNTMTRSRSQGHVVRLTGVGLAHKPRTKVPKISELPRRLLTSRAITCAPGSRSKGQRLMSPLTRPINAETESVSPTNLTSNLVGGWSMRHQLPWPAIRALWSWVIEHGRKHTVSAARPHNLFLLKTLMQFWCHATKGSAIVELSGKYLLDELTKIHPVEQHL